MTSSGPTGPRLEAATELVGAMLLADDPSFYWDAVQRVMTDVVDENSGPNALAELLFGLSSLGALLATKVADHTGEEPACVLRSMSAPRKPNQP